MTEIGIFYATGRRKTAVAKVRLGQGGGSFSINRKSPEDYFQRAMLVSQVQTPLTVTESAGRFDVIAEVSGGGKAGQAGAICHGLARALIRAHPEMRSTLKTAGLLTRDPRKKERKKYGQPGARKRFQFSKR